jgi:hypothetical protein
MHALTASMQTAVALVAVTVSLLYTVWSFMSVTRRQRVLDALARRGMLQQVAARHRAKLALPGGCGKCSAAGAHKVLRR